MATENPRPFLLLMPSYNQAHYIRQAVDSVLAQDDPDWELWILDNSSDGTPALMAGYGDPRIRFRHAPERMDPGTCLNRMLEWAQGEHFSYIHTDNVLAPGYVRAMRAALAGHPLSLAYCDMHMIDAAGRRTHLNRRGRFDLARLLSHSPLGVPFAATTALAREVGGFRADDVADDVLFCARAWGRGPWTYLPEPLLEYRHHPGSRTEDVGFQQVRRKIHAAFDRLLPELQARGHDPLGAMQDALASIARELRLAAEDSLLRLRHAGVDLPGAGDPLGRLWRAGLLRMPDLNRREGAPGPLAGLLATRGWREPVRRLALRREVADRMRLALKSHEDAFRYLLPALARLRIGDGPARWQAGSADPLTLWACALLEREPDWSVSLAVPASGNRRWPAASGHASAWIDLSGRGQLPAGVPGITT